MLTNYKFGSVTINGKIVRNDVIVSPNGEVRAWEREKHHLFQLEDIKKEVLEMHPEIVIFGTGAYGMARLSPEAKEFIQNNNIRVTIQRTRAAIELFNSLVKEGKNAIGFFHLTC